VVRGKEGIMANLNDDADDLEQRRLCDECVGDQYLRAEVVLIGEMRYCHYCERERQTISLGQFADRVQKVFTSHYTATARNHDSADVEEGEPAIAIIRLIAGADDAPAADTEKVLISRSRHIPGALTGKVTEFGQNVRYKLRLPFSLGLFMTWSNFERSLKAEARLFNKTARTMLASIFSGISQFTTGAGTPVIKTVFPDTRFFRARVFHSTECPSGNKLSL
jgi:hypothetical protein